jgi:hypothetical protein
VVISSTSLFPSFAAGGSAPHGAQGRPPSRPINRRFRLVDGQGAPHPVLDDHYDSLEAAWGEAMNWWQESGAASGPVAIGVEVSTASGSWRTLRHPGM